MKKFLILFVCVVMSAVAMAIDTYKVKFVKIGSYDRGTMVICEGGKTFYSVSQRQYTGFFNSLRSGDIIEVEEYENRILGIRKIGHETPSTMTDGVIYDNGYSYGGGYYGGGYYGVGGGVHVQFGSSRVGGHIDVPVNTIINGIVGTVQTIRANRQARRDVANSQSSRVVTTAPVHQNQVIVRGTSNNSRVAATGNNNVVRRPATSPNKVTAYQMVRPSQMF